MKFPTLQDGEQQLPNTIGGDIVDISIAGVSAATAAVSQAPVREIAPPEPVKAVEAVESKSGARTSARFERPATNLERSARQYLALLESTGDAEYAAALSGLGGNLAIPGALDTYA
ncbi:MAG: hypothetical protein AB7N71_04935 [Phycisphaerae bacterium]